MNGDTQSDETAGPSGLSPVALLLAAHMERVEREGAAAIEALCAQHPEHAGELRRRFAALSDLGLLEGPRVFGHYRVLRTLGQGGMGIVYLARDEQLGRTVALKALPTRLAANPRALARFQREIRAVAQLRHEGIVPIYAMGREDGVPFFTMEHVDGRTLADLVTELRALELAPEQLEARHLAGSSEARSWVEAVCHVVLDVAEALDHAHRHGVVHRDVKPSNILLRTDGRALLFDFGLARVEDEQGLTLTGDFAGTPYYVSPEQVNARAGALDQRTDVYSLGVTLYELLTLQRPFTGESTEQVFRQITSREPPLPRRCNPLIPRDLETICLTALEKEPARRYQTAADLAADLRALLEFRPVRARPAGFVRRALRQVRRHRAVSVAVVCAALLVVGTPVGLWQANVAIRAEKDRAVEQFDRAELALQQVQVEADRAALAAEQALSEAARANSEAELARAATALAVLQNDRANKALEFLVSVLTSVDPLRDDRNVPMVEVLGRAADRMSDVLRDEPYMEGIVRQNIGLAFKNLGMYAEAEAQFRRAIELAEPADADQRNYLLCLACNNLSTVLARTERLEEARELAGLALELGRDEPRISFDMYTSFLNSAGFIASMSGDKPAAREAYAEVLERRLQELPEEHPRTVEAMLNVAANLEDRAEGEAMNRRVLGIQERTLPPDDPQIAMTLGNLAIGRYLQRDSVGALELEERALSIFRARLGDRHEEVLRAQVVLAMIHGRLGRHAEAAALLEDSVEGFRSVLPNGHSRVVVAMCQLAEAWHELGRDAECVPLLEEALAMQLRIQPGRTEAVEACRAALAEARARVGGLAGDAAEDAGGIGGG